MQLAIVMALLSSVSFAKEQWALKTNSAGDPVLKCKIASGETVSFMQYYLQSDKLSAEVEEQFKANYPDLWKVAIQSSGNTHNPKVIPLRPKFTEMLLNTHTLKDIDKVARIAGYTIVGAEHEKFHIQKTETGIKVFAATWLKLKKVTDKGAVSERKPSEIRG